MKIFIILACFLQSTAFASSCAYLHKENHPGALSWGSSNMQPIVEKYILETFDKAHYPTGIHENRSSCQSIPVQYSCSTSDLCETFCVASSVSEQGEHTNAIFTVNRCEKRVQLLKVVSDS